MQFDTRLWAFMRGVRLRLLATIAVGLLSTVVGIARLALLGVLLGAVLTGSDFKALWPLVAAVVAVMLLRGYLEYARAMVAHKTAAHVQKTLRRTIYDKLATLGPAAVGRQRAGVLTLSLVDGVEQLETYFGQFLPQLVITLMAPLLVFAVMAFVDLPVAAVLTGFAILALVAPALWRRIDAENARVMRTTYAGFAAEFLDAIQGLPTLKAFGQSSARGERLYRQARSVFRTMMRVLGTNILGRGITDSSIACGAAAALALGAYRVDSGAMTLSALLIILMLGLEVFRPMRELRNVLHQGMLGMSAAQGIHGILDDQPIVADHPPAKLDGPLAPTIEFENVRFRYPDARAATGFEGALWS